MKVSTNAFVPLHQINSLPWMSYLPDEISLANISIPGTHDSGAQHGFLAIKCQDLKISEQLDAGVRYLDIRCRKINNSFTIHHDCVYQNMNFDDVMGYCQTFFEKHPSETIVMRVKDEYSANDDNCTLDFEQIFRNYVNKYPNMWYLDTTIPSLADVRGKIVLLRNFTLAAGITSYGINYDNIQNEDEYSVWTVDQKWTSTKKGMDNAKANYNKTTLYLTQASGYCGLARKDISDQINPKIKDYCDGIANKGLGIIAVDYVNGEICRQIILTNYGFKFFDKNTKIVPFDCNGDGKKDLFVYIPGKGAGWVVRSNEDGTFTAVYAQGDGIAGYDLLSPDDKVLVFDYDGDGKDDLFLYRPGKGAAWVAKSNGDGTFTAVYAQGHGGNGIAGYDLLSPDDKVLAFDYNGDGKDDLFLYRPGKGAAWVARSNGDGTFTAVYAQGHGGNGIAGYDLLSPDDKVLVFDYNGDGKDDLFLYRPGKGAAWAAKSNGDGTFTAVYAQGHGGNGIAGYDLLSPDDKVLVFDYNGDGKDDLFLYRPGKSAAWVAKSNGDGTFTAVYAQGDQG
ncbi:periplasmic component of the Tol biopolymer transport system [Desulfosporosinus orientis DSM 765]|uniref:1-phosphatidylinositol phosphodiesterase n=1 Tax=Desulfosporosinus orientis (strain ATCC 19365 / DSM 765 / NCIMB 8382 / VKM B-1628 / Singapore I) TaxID=768706 RepID=G7WJE5_DESOD|nr:phosphatidylinositol-specific phospholipase C domain-containing protein [Desulfosporosinus orientis]AET69804.1 periplasmic component of the Tol biopolymer transport system [Desulfosporosinus orientis DSM 765]